VSRADSEKRKVGRIQPFVVSCRVLDEGRVLTGYLMELSTGGARVSCEDEPPALGSAMVLEVRLGKEVPQSRVTVEVKWVRLRSDPGGHHTFGVDFRGVSPEEEKVIKSIVEEFKRRAAELS